MMRDDYTKDFSVEFNLRSVVFCALLCYRFSKLSQSLTPTFVNGLREVSGTLLDDCQHGQLRST